ncbi:hypothetical protein [Bradyrhizobium sp. STM 3809]|uniref:hypothetical protein n=1 Tax=Bradyrhizobium sp. STM 3809 TaxID=551936 RepID=UPI00024081A0|nr:hypothetical protein [Bradyrhizobium sp. STM 3809]CCE02924.1 conserved exported hypothetical protein [Bradyrhizobium sp. STM 3809]
MAAAGLTAALMGSASLAAVPPTTQPAISRPVVSVRPSAPQKPAMQMRPAIPVQPATAAKPATRLTTKPTANPAAEAKPAKKPAASPRIADNSAPISFALVKGGPDSCGPGCDSWIAAEGKIDGSAAARLRKFMKQIGERKLPIYFNSPGGNVEQALAMGNWLREKKASVRVGRTIVRECGFEAQEGDVCTKLKLSGRELHGEVWTRGSMCNSACPYIILGAPTRELAPDVTLAVHSPRVILNFTGGVPTHEMRVQALQRAMERADKMVLDYINKLGADPGLLAAARSVPFESMRILTREEIARFALDRRERIESPWMFEAAARGIAYKTVLSRSGGETTFRTTRFQLVCFDQDRFELDVERNAGPAVGAGILSIASGDLRLNFLSPPRRSGERETWGVFLNGSQMKTLASSSAVELADAPAGGVRPGAAGFPVGSDGLQTVLKKLTDGCPSSKAVIYPSGMPVPWMQVPSPQASAQPAR